MASKKNVVAPVEPVRLPDTKVSISKGTFGIEIVDFGGKLDVKLTGIDTIHTFEDLEEFSDLLLRANLTLTDTSKNVDCEECCCECCGCNNGLEG